jgi:AraC-like DNA-binding protein
VAKDGAGQEEGHDMATTPLVTDTPSQLVVTDEVHVCRAALPGFPLDVIRTGIGDGPNITRSLDLDDCVIASRVIQFPIVARTDIVDDRILAVLITSAPEGSRWSEVDVEAGTVLLYGSGSEHSEISPSGLSYSFALIDVERLKELADNLNLSLRIPDNGTVKALAPTPNVQSLAVVLNSRRNPLLASAFNPSQGMATLHAVAEVLSENTPNNGDTKHGKVDSGYVVRICIQYAESIGRTPTLPELCMVGHVSQRRLRTAFNDIVGLPPLKYFQYRQLNKARIRLVNENKNVGYVAMDLGFTHLGRFANRYNQLFGELPSTTLKNHN